jgi:hypothetical protein
MGVLYGVALQSVHTKALLLPRGRASQSYIGQWQGIM